MANRTVVADSVDPLSGLNGPLFFRRTIKASADDGSLPSNSSDLKSIHNVMKSLELSSQEKQMNEAKRIVDDRGELLESGLDGILKNAYTTDAIAAKVKGKPQERRPGLTRARKKGPFSLRTSSSQPSVSLAPTLNFDQLQDPDELFDAYERIENAKREVLKQQGGNVENLNQNNPSTRTRRQRPGILGKTYNKKHLYSLAPPADHDMSIFTQEEVEQGIPSAHKDEVGDKLVDLDPKSDVDVDEIELAVSARKAENDVTSILDHLLSGNDEELDGEGALNLLQDRLKIKPLDLGRFSMLSAGDSFLKARKSSLVIDSSLKNVKNKSPVVDKQVAPNPVNLVSSPTPPRSPFASLFLLKKRILQSNPLKDPFSPLNRYSESHNALIVQPVDKQREQANTGENLSLSAESNPRVEVEITEHTRSMVAQKVFESEGSPHDQLVSVRRATDEKKQNQMSNYNSEETVNIEQNEAQKVAEGEDSSFDQFEDGNVSIVRGAADNRPNNILDYNTEEITNLENQDPDLSVTQDNAMDDSSTRAEEQPTVNQADLQRARKAAGKKRIRNAHPLRKSIAESGTSFENGIRRSKRIKMRPLQYWKGERPLYGRINNSLKLIGIKCISPGKSDADLKVKPYISSELYEYKDLLDLAARH